MACGTAPLHFENLQPLIVISMNTTQPCENGVRRRGCGCWQALEASHESLLNSRVPQQAIEVDLTAVKNNWLWFWDAMLSAATQRVGVRHLVTEDLEDGFELAGVGFVNPFEAANNRLIDEVLPPR
jgi:predicted nucleic acid-binding protein